MPTLLSIPVSRALAADAAADGDALTAALIGGVVAVVLALIGWLLHAWFRRRDHRRADLTETARTLGRVDLEVRRLMALRRALRVEDFETLDELLLHVQRAAARSTQGRRLKSLESRLTRLADVVARFTATASAATEDVERAHLAVSALTDVPAALSLHGLVGAVQDQVRGAEEVAAAVRAAEDRVERLRAA
ncbi:hypothetical protein [Streptomyces sp. MA5143a]|uniref:hypothetical protein n=1 Tax=Streptomyces sp. MA5143a TaxID=2083010 RepID=UPI000D2EB79A|nr:hypothetical protein [Streptomyces sp. MA5143a]SPF00493.1 hypothetical protein SMA5143A_1207 [Streptomyces sp. MA5143a]